MNHMRRERGGHASRVAEEHIRSVETARGQTAGIRSCVVVTPSFHGEDAMSVEVARAGDAHHR